MSDDDENGFTYHVSDEQLLAFARCSVAQRLDWLEEMREFSIAASTAEVRASWRRLRAGAPWADLEAEDEER